MYAINSLQRLLVPVPVCPFTFIKEPFCKFSFLISFLGHQGLLGLHTVDACSKAPEPLPDWLAPLMFFLTATDLEITSFKTRRILSSPAWGVR